MERLQKVIANSGYCSRRKAEELISKGQVYVNGEKKYVLPDFIVSKRKPTAVCSH